MIIKNTKNAFILAAFICSTMINAQAIDGIDNLDKEFLESLPDEVREDVIKELEDNI